MQNIEIHLPTDPLWIASDHAGFELKSQIVKDWPSQRPVNSTLVDLGTDSVDSVDYPDFAEKLISARASRDENPLRESGEGIRWDQPFGILICGSGQGMAIKANRDARVRAALCWDQEIAGLARRHNDANILVLAARSCPPELAWQMIHTFFTTDFEGGRHRRRVLKLSSTESPGSPRKES